MFHCCVTSFCFVNDLLLFLCSAQSFQRLNTSFVRRLFYFYFVRLMADDSGDQSRTSDEEWSNFEDSEEPGSASDESNEDDDLTDRQSDDNVEKQRKCSAIITKCSE